VARSSYRPPAHSRQSRPLAATEEASYRIPVTIYDPYDDLPDDEPERRRAPRSTMKVVGGLLAFVLVVAFTLVTCVRAYVGSVPERTAEVNRQGLTAEVPKFVALPSLGSDGTRTHGIWVTLRNDGTAFVISSRGPERACFVNYVIEQAFYRDTCTKGTYDRAGTPLSGFAARSLDRFEARVTGDAVIVDLERTRLGACRPPSTESCSPASAPVYHPTY